MIHSLTKAGQQKFQDLGAVVVEARVVWCRVSESHSSLPNILAAINGMEVFVPVL